jgi:hypothetical protein
MVGLHDMVAYLEGRLTGDPEQQRQIEMEKTILKTLKWFARWQVQIKESVAGWKDAEELAKTDPGVANIQNEFPGSSLVTRHEDGTSEITYPPDEE